MTVAHAMQTFLSNLELTDRQRAEAKRQKEVVREVLRQGLSRDDDFISGSYARKTAIRPLNDIDLFVVLNASTNADLRNGQPSHCLKAVRDVLDAAYPNKPLPILQNRSVNIEFSGTGIGYDVVPAFLESGNYVIPDRDTDRWIRTNPRIHKERITAANQRAANKLIPLVKALKRWNNLNGKPLRSFHIEVMACNALTTDPGSYLDGLHKLFTDLSSAVYQTCPEPAGLGPHLDADLTPGKRQHASELLAKAAKMVERARDFAGDGFTEHAHFVLRALLGDDYPEQGTDPDKRTGPAVITSGSSVDSSGNRYG